MSEQIKRTDIAEEGVLDNLIKPLSDLKKILSETDQGLKSFAETVEGKLNFGQKAKELREFAAAEKDVNEIYKEKRSVQSETMKADNEIAKLKEKLAALTSQEAKEVANLKAEIAAQNREMQANARATQTQTEAYSRLVKETRDAKNESKELGAQLRELEKTGQSNTQAYEQLANKYQQTTERAAQLDKELKGLDKSVGDNFRNVGNYESALEGVNQKVAEGGMTFRQMSQAIKEYQTIAAQAGRDTPIGRKAIEDAAKLQDYLTSIRTQTTRLADDGANMKAALTLGTTVTQGYQGVLSVQALLGDKSEEMLKLLTKIQATQGILNSLNAVRNALDKDSILVLKAREVAQRLFNTGIETGTKLTRNLNAALKASVAGAVIAGIIALISQWDKLRTALGGASKEMQEYQKTQSEAIKGTTDLRAKVLDMKIAFDAAKDGVLDKEKALKKYNDEFGDTLGFAKDLNEAEEIFAAKTGAYIKATMLRAQATALLNKAAEEQVKALAPEESDLVGTWDYILGGITTGLFGVQAGAEMASKSVSNNLANLQETTAKRAATFTEMAERLLREAMQIESEFEIARDKNTTKADKKRVEKRRKLKADLDAIFKEETKDAERAEDDRLAIQERALEQEYKTRQLANIQRFKDKKHFEEAELERELELIDALIELRRDYDKDVTDLELQRAKMLQKFNDEQIKESKRKASEMVDYVSILYNQQADNTINALKRQEDAATQMFSVFEKLAAEGNITAQQSLAEMINRQEEAQRRQMQMERRKLRMQQAQQVSSILLNQLEQGKSPGEALAAAGAFLATSGTLLASLPSFDVGTENTSGGGRGVDGKGGFLAINHPDERIMTAEQNKKVGGLSNPMLADIAYKYRTGQLNDNAGNSYDLIRLEGKLTAIEQAIQNQPQQVVGLEETLSGMVEMMVKNIKGNHTKTTIYKS
jgi:DNA repair exonuclease SbcCD ATPase subunit